MSRPRGVYVRGRSIDGRVYAQVAHTADRPASHLSAVAWTSHRAYASRMTESDAERVIAARRDRNRLCDADSIIGRLEMSLD